jgi:subtilisin-like proprotein convertase family protein
MYSVNEKAIIIRIFLKFIAYKKYLKLFLFLIAVIFFCFINSSLLYSQCSYSPFVESVLTQLKADSLNRFNRELTGDTTCTIDNNITRIISRYWESAGNQMAAQYIYQKLIGYGYAAEYWSFSQTGVNVLGFKMGTRYPNQKIIICAHYDDIVFGNVPDTTHGADDNASGTSAVIEAARILKNTDMLYTVVFAFWDEEERMMYGSDAYADTCRRNGDSIIAVINLDMIGWDGNNDKLFRVGTDTSSRDLAKLIMSASKIYVPVLNPVQSLLGSDEVSFIRRGYKANLIIEDGYPDFNPYYHTVEDNYEHINKPYFFELTQVATASLLVLANDYLIKFEHDVLTNTNDTGARIAEVIIKSRYGIGTLSNSPILYYKAGNGPFAPLNFHYNSLDTFRFLIPGNSAHTMITYYIAAQDSAGTLVGSLPYGARGFNPPGHIPPSELFNYFITDDLIKCSNTLPKDIPVRTIVYDSITITQTGVVSDVDVNLTLLHPIASDIAIWLVHSGIPMNQLSIYNGGSAANYINTTFDDESEISISQGTPPFTGRFRPQQPLYSFDNTQLQGLWRLRVFNNSTIYTGQLMNWCINIQYYEPIGIVGNQLPISSSLSQNYPNPFNSSTSINYSLNRKARVKIIVYDVTGRESKVLINKNLSVGNYVLSFNVNDLASGIYFYTMYMDGAVFETKKMIMIK